MKVTELTYAKCCQWGSIHNVGCYCPNTPIRSLVCILSVAYCILKPVEDFRWLGYLVSWQKRRGSTMAWAQYLAVCAGASACSWGVLHRANVNIESLFCPFSQCVSTKTCEPLWDFHCSVLILKRPLSKGPGFEADIQTQLKSTGIDLTLRAWGILMLVLHTMQSMRLFIQRSQLYLTTA